MKHWLRRKGTIYTANNGMEFIVTMEPWIRPLYILTCWGQYILWKMGFAVHNRIFGECTPDFNCCLTNWKGRVMISNPLTPKVAILKLAEMECLMCHGSGYPYVGGSKIICPRCKGTGAMFPSLRRECGGSQMSKGCCDGRDWTPISHEDEWTIRLALETAGYECHYNRRLGGWLVYPGFLGLYNESGMEVLLNDPEVRVPELVVVGYLAANVERRE